MKRKNVGRRLLATLLVGLMTLSAAKMPVMATEGEEEHVYSVPEHPVWDAESPGTAYVDITDGTRGHTVAILYKDGSKVMSYWAPSEGVTKIKYKFFRNMYESGTYTFKVKLSANDGPGADDMTTGAVSEVSAPFEYTRPSATIATPVNIHWSSDQPNVAMWDAVENADSYRVNLFAGERYVVGMHVSGDRTSWDFSDRMADTESTQYTFSVDAYSPNINIWANSDRSERSEVYGRTSSEEVIQDNIANAANADESTVNDAVNQLKAENDVNAMCSAIQNSETAQADLNRLEDTYKQKNGITVNKTSEVGNIPASDMSVIGAGLNATAGSTVTLNVSETPTRPEYDTDIYTNVVTFDMKLVNENGETSTEITNLEIPAVITLPIPAGMDTSRLFILHFLSDGTHEKITPAIIDSGTKAKFTITHFSTFAFANESSGSGTYRDCEWENINGKSYWYENNVRQGTASDTKCFSYEGTLRGREIYDPASDGWYWLDVNADGAKAVGKEVFMPYIYQNEAEWKDNEDELNRNAAASGADAEGNTEHAELADQIKRAIQNGTGKWVRYDNEGKMMKGWITIEGDLADLYPDQVGNRYYYDRKTGLMAKGETVIDGVTYYFDERTGVLR